MKKDKPKWILTDYDAKQYCREISENIFEFKEYSKEFKKVIQGTIDLNDYSIDEQKNYIASYGYSLNEIDKQLIAECIWETDIFDFI